MIFSFRKRITETKETFKQSDSQKKSLRLSVKRPNPPHLKFLKKSERVDNELGLLGSVGREKTLTVY